jgi:type I restriction enzyme S subunit
MNSLVGNSIAPDAWPTRKLGDVAEFKNGLNYLEGDRGYEIKIVGVQDFQDNFTISYESLGIVSLATQPKEADLLRDGDLLIVRSNGNKKLIGRVLLIKNVQEPISHSGFTIRARIITPELLPEFVGLYLRSFSARRQIYVLGGGTNISNLSQEILSQLDVPVPSIEEQRRIALVLNACDREIELLRQQIAALEKQKQGLMQKLLTGQIRVKAGEQRGAEIENIKIECDQRDYRSSLLEE